LSYASQCRARGQESNLATSGSHDNPLQSALTKRTRLARRDQIRRSPLSYARTIILVRMAGSAPAASGSRNRRSSTRAPP